MSIESIQRSLTAAGYEFVQIEPRLPGIKEAPRPDAVAWANDGEGNLVPWAVVETKRSSGQFRPEVALPALARTRDLLGTIDHYVVVNGVDWYQADQGLQRLTRVDGPSGPPNGGVAAISDVDLLAGLLSEDLWKSASRARAQGSQIDFAWPTDFDLRLKGFRTSTGAWIPASDKALWEARRRSIVDFARQDRHGAQFTSNKAVTSAVVRLAAAKLASDLLDPFCGTGSFLWEAIDHASEQRTGLRSASGYELVQSTAAIASSIAEVSPVPVRIIQDDAFTAELPVVSCVLSAPPMGMRLTAEHELLDGSKTRDGDLVALDTVLRALGPGGRAVLHLPSSVTMRSTGEAYRRYLATHFRVAALLGLPPGAVPGTGIRSVLLVIDNAQPSDTFIAQLGEDWQVQLSESGAVLEAARVHVDRTAS